MSLSNIAFLVYSCINPSFNKYVDVIRLWLALYGGLQDISEGVKLKKTSSASHGSWLFLEHFWKRTTLRISIFLCSSELSAVMRQPVLILSHMVKTF